jgi:hypothetical protein
MTITDDPDTYVREHKDRLRKIVRYGDDEWTRSLALAALVEYGDRPDVDQLRDEIDRMEAADA